MQDQNLPNPSLYLVLTIVGFLFGILWGILCIGPYRTLKVAVANGDGVLAQEQAKKIRIYVIIGVVLNVLIFVGQMARGGML